MLILLIPVLAFAIGVGLHLAVRKEDRNREGVAETLTAWFLFVFLGIMGVFAFLGHAFMAEETAEQIGFPAGNPFQFEVAVANLGFGVLGLMCLRWRGNFWWAAAIGYTVFLWGAAYGHIYEMVVNNNHEPGNTGFPLYADIITPLIAFALLTYYERVTSGKAVKEESPPTHLPHAA